MHTYDSPVYGKWFEPGTMIENDDSLSEGTCNTMLASNGVFTYFLFDLENDPYETENLYNSTSDDIEAVKTSLYAMLEIYADNAKSMTGDDQRTSKATLAAWKDHNYYIVPWVNEADLEPAFGTYPRSCYNTSMTTLHPTQSPANSPTVPPAVVPTRSHQPTTMPTKLGDDDDLNVYWDDASQGNSTNGTVSSADDSLFVDDLVSTDVPTLMPTEVTTLAGNESATESPTPSEVTTEEPTASVSADSVTEAPSSSDVSDESSR
jgi:hypothetical protein